MNLSRALLKVESLLFSCFASVCFLLDFVERYGGVDWKELSAKLNPKFNWEGAIQDVLGMDISLNQVSQFFKLTFIDLRQYETKAELTILKSSETQLTASIRLQCANHR